MKYSILTTEPSADYELIDSGEGKKLERYGRYVLSRPDPGALWKKNLTEEEWKKADAEFIRMGEKGEWRGKKNLPTSWPITFGRLKLLIKLSSFKHTGLFPEQEPNWAWMEELIAKRSARGEPFGKVLNLFAYTGSFSVYAAAGGASEVVTVDLSKTYLNWAGRNMQLNGFSKESTYKFIHGDVLQYLKTLPTDYFDLIIMDPPTFSNSKRMEDFLDIQRDHVELINDCIAVLKPRGVLYFSTNFRRFVLGIEGIKADSVKDITKVTTPFDFEGKLFRWCFRIIK